MASATVYTDGACIDQGTGKARAGYGVYWGDGHKNNRFGRVTGPQDSNRAELRAAHQAIKTHLSFGFLQNRELMHSIHDMSKKINVSVAYIKGHSGVHGNEQAHMLAKAGTKL
ncbi:hypothetical protein CAEBREN_07681 [Caenorhabditis brenneri]|uniref:ribonuclease H n=1 Tax=Caenorhabditis brenneri TaxID=135651 RepID=G0PFT2_CAEBE|nr:hypothetical protein CAEBREN_07681 [Caenorhabditis brenneri]